MKSRTTWILIVLAIIVAGLVFWDSKKGTSTDEVAVRRKRLLDLKAEDVSRLELVRTNQTIVLEKTADRWGLAQPLRYRASGAAVSSILSELEFAECDRFLSEQELRGVNLAEFGLDTPRLRAKLTTSRGPVTVLVGRETPTKEAVYVQIEGRKTVGITRKSLAERLETKLDDLREHDVMDTPAGSITRLEIKSADRSLELAKTDARWAVARPLALRADQSKAGELASDLAALRVQEFVSDDAKDLHTYQLDEPVREVTAFTGDKSKTLQIGRSPTNDANQVYAKLRGMPTVFTLPAAAAKKFAIQPNDVRDPQIMAFKPDDVRSITVTRGSEKIESARDTNNVWRITAPKPMPAEESVIKNMLAGFSGLTATQFVADVATDLAKYGLATPLATVTAQGEGTNILAQLLVDLPAASNEVRYVKRADEPFIYGVATNSLDWLPVNALAWRVRRVVELKVNDVTQITIEKPTGKTVLARDKDGKWTMVEPAQGVLDNDGLNQLLESISQLTATTFIREGAENLGEFGLEPAAVTITLGVAGRTIIARLGKTTPAGEQYVAWSDPSLVFTVPGYSLTALTRDLVTVPATNTTSQTP